MKNHFKRIMFMLILGFCFIGNIQAKPKACYEIKKKATCNISSGCVWKNKKCRVRACNSLTQKKICNNSTSSANKSCKWVNGKCCPDGICNSSGDKSTSNAINSTNKTTSDPHANGSGTSNDINGTNSTTKNRNVKLSCIYSLLDENGNNTGLEFSVEPKKDSDGQIVKITDSSKKINGRDTFETKLYWENYTVGERNPNYPLKSQNECGVFLYTINGVDEVAYIMADRDPKELVNSFRYIGKIKRSYDAQGNQVDNVHKQLSPITPSINDRNKKSSTNYESFYDESIKYKSCGGINRIPKFLPTLTTSLYKTIKFLVPLLLIVMGIKDFVQAMISKDENTMKEQQKKFIKRIVAAIVIFFLLSLVQFFIRLANADNKEDTLSCIDCLINNVGSCGEFDYTEWLDSVNTNGDNASSSSTKKSTGSTKPYSTN